MPGIAFNFKVLNRAIAALEQGSPADQAKAQVMKQHENFACLGALGPDLLQYIPLESEIYEKRDELMTKLAENALEPQELIELVTLHRKVLMAGYGELFETVRWAWPLLEEVSSLFEEIQKIVDERNSISDLQDKVDELKALRDKLGGEVDHVEVEEVPDEPEEADESEGVFDPEAVARSVVTLNVNSFPNIQTAPTGGLVDQAVNPAFWRHRELLKWRRSGQFVRELVERAGDDPKLRAYAYGYMVHVAAAVTGEPFINNIVGGPARTHWWRNRWVRNYVDAWTHGYYQSGATMNGDEPDPSYWQWPSLCGANLHQKIDLGLGMSGLDAVGAVLEKSSGSSMPSSPELDKLAAYLSEAATATYGDIAPALLSQFAPDFGPETFKEAYVGAFAVLWLQTGGEGPICPKDIVLLTPKHCSPEPPEWLEQWTSAPNPKKYKPAATAAIVLAILMALAALLSVLVAALAALIAAAIATGVAVHQLWDEVECIMYWARRGQLRTEHQIRTVLHSVTFTYPLGRDLYKSTLVGNSFQTGPKEDETGQPLTRTRAPDFDYPRGMFAKPPEDSSNGEPEPRPDVDYMEYPGSGKEELGAGLFPGKNSECLPSFATGRYPDFAAEGQGLVNGGILVWAEFPFRSGADGQPTFFGSAVENAVQVISQEAESLPDYNLDADYGYGWLCWEPDSGTFPSQPPLHPTPIS